MRGRSGPGDSAEILAGLPAAGADVIEIGMPFSDPMADGPTIQAGSLRALKAGMTLARTLDLVRASCAAATRPRRSCSWATSTRSGATAPSGFLDDARAAGVDGLIVVDLPPEEDDELCVPAHGRGLHFIRLVTPTTDDRRLPKVLGNAGGFLYYVSITGITDQGADRRAGRRGGRAAAPAHALPVAVGFGIRTPAQAAAIARVADAAVIGSALVAHIADALDPNGHAPPGLAASLLAQVGELAAAVRTPGMARHELAHRLRPPQDQGAGAQQPPRGAREPLGALSELRAHDLSPRSGIEPACARTAAITSGSAPSSASRRCSTRARGPGSSCRRRRPIRSGSATASATSSA